MLVQRRNAYRMLPSVANVSRQVNTQQGFAQLSSGSTFYTVRGPADGSKVVLIHGITVFGFAWDETSVFLAQHNYRVLHFDLFGRGFSSSPHGMQYNDLDFVRQLRELLDHVFGADNREPVTLVGISMGGGIAARFAELYPDLVSRVVLIASAGIHEEPGISGRYRSLSPRDLTGKLSNTHQLIDR